MAAELGAAARFVPLDVTDAASWQAAMDCAQREFGEVTGLVNNAGIVHVDPIETLSEADFRKVLDVRPVDLWTAFFVKKGRQLCLEFFEGHAACHPRQACTEIFGRSRHVHRNRRHEPVEFAGDPYGTRTRVFAVRGRRPRPLDEGAFAEGVGHMWADAR